MKKVFSIILILYCAKFTFSQSIEKFSIDSGGKAISEGGIDMLYTIGEVAVAERSTIEISISEGFINSSFRVALNPKVFLQGPMLNPIVSGLMNDHLRANDYIPLISPYNDAVVVDDSVFNTGGSSGSGTIHDDIVDWVWVELRAGYDNTKLINGKSALLQRDGDIVGLDGVSHVIMNAPPSNHHVVIKHRNHSGIMSINPIAVSEGSTAVVNFKDSSFPTFGSHAQVQLTSNIMALWAGNVNGDERTRYQGSNNDSNAIKDLVLDHPNNINNSNLFFYFAYDNGDVNMDGRIRYQGSNNDTNLIKDIIIDHPLNSTNTNLFFFTVQVPNNN